jgi:two-component system response regulator HydG
MAITILVVDDEAEVRSLLGQCLAQAGFAVATAGDGEEARARMRSDRPAAVLLDLTMPRLGGLEALPEMKRIAPDTPVIIICTAHADVATAVSALRLGAYDYLTKPFDLELVRASARRAVERAISCGRASRRSRARATTRGSPSAWARARPSRA